MFKFFLSICLSFFIISNVLLIASEEKPVSQLLDANGALTSQKAEEKKDYKHGKINFIPRTYVGCNFILNSNEIASRSPLGFTLEDGFDAEITLGLGLMIGDLDSIFDINNYIELYARYYFAPDIEQDKLDSQITSYSDHLQIGGRYITYLRFHDGFRLPIGLGGGIDFLFPDDDAKISVDQKDYLLVNLENKINPYTELSLPWVFIELNMNYTFGINKFGIEVGLYHTLELLIGLIVSLTK